MTLPAVPHNNLPPAFAPSGAAPAFTATPPAFAPLGLGVSQEQKLELLEYWRSITKRKWAILGLAFIVAVLASVVAFAIAPVYKSTATLLIEAGKVKVLSIEDVYTNSQQREHYQTQVEILKSREVAERTAKALKLWEHPAFDPRKAAPSWRARAFAAVGMGEVKTTWAQDELERSAIVKLAGQLSVEPVRLSQLVKVSFESDDPKLAALVANAIANEYIDADRDSRFKLSQQVSSFLQERLASLREKLQTSEQALQAYREQKGIVSLGGSAQAVSGRQVSDTTERLVLARTRRAELESSYLQAKKATPAEYAEIPAVMRDPIVANTLNLANTAKRNLATLQETLGNQHYKVVQAQAEYADLQKQLVTQSQAVVASLRREYEAARSTEVALEASLGTAQGSVQAVNREEFQLSVLEREATSNRQLYEMFMSRAKETNLASDVQAAVARVVDRAVPPTIPVRPAKVQIVLVAAVLALFLGAMASLLMDRLDNTLKGGDDAELRLRLPVLTALPLMEGHDRAKMARAFLDQSHSHYAEGIRTARTGVLLSSLDAPHKVLLVTSTLPGEGKTTVSVNLALAHAQTKKTLLIDADMRRSQAGRSLGLGAGLKGLTNLVAGNAEAAECVYPIKDSKLMVMPVGDLPPNPLELLLSQKFKEALAALSQEYEMVVIDSPPVELVSEALVLAPMATSVAFVVKAMSTPAPLARKSIQRIQRAGGNILGVVVNQLDFKHAQRYYGEYGGGGYSYGGYGYGTYDEKAQLEGGGAKTPRAKPERQGTTT
jgi:succinoglycan biosynthesis transport protein ExoP